MTPIPPLRGTRPAGAPVVRRRLPGPAWSQGRLGGWSPVPRRPVLAAALAAGTAVGFAALGLFPAVRRARAEGYTIYNRCPSYAVDHNCSPGCGPSTIYGDACNTSGSLLGFHKSDGVNWTLRPNQCFSGGYDGWLWMYSGACGACACYVERRCHDGYRRTGSGWVKSICRWNTQCGCPTTVAWPTVRRGDVGVDVYTVQHLLTARGFATTADGIFGSNTEARVREFEAASGLTVDGVVGGPTWERLVITVDRGDQGGAVTAAQRQLNAYGYQLTLDGIFGVLTEGAVLDFQRQNGLSATGVVAASTWRTLTGGSSG